MSHKRVNLVNSLCLANLVAPPEPLGGAHWDPDEMARRVKATILKALEEVSGTPPEELVERRYKKYRRMGAFLEGGRLVGRRLPGGEGAPTPAP